MNELDQIVKRVESLPSHKQGPTALELSRTLYLEDFYLYSKLLEFTDVNWQTHGEVVRVFEAESERKLIVLPRGSFKSSLGCVAYPMWRLEQDPNKTILLDSEIFNNSKNFLREIKGHYQSDSYRSIFGDKVGDKWDAGEITISTRTKTRKEASITVGGLGTVKVGQHYDIIIGDDYNSPQNSDSTDKCLKVIDHVRYNLSILNPGGEYVFIGTRYAERDVLGFLLNDVLGEKHLAEGKLKLSDPSDRGVSLSHLEV